ncbi:MAG: recombinase family protein [Candidatus Omnitrophota bacterium]
MQPVAIYARVSDASQCVDTQLVALRDYCQRMGYQVISEYVDNGFSGKDMNRPEFERLLGDIRTGKVFRLLVWRLDRVGRSLQHLIALFAEFKSRGVEFISLTQNINTESPEGKMFWQLLGVFAEYERELIIARTKAGLERARRQGKTLGRPHGAIDKKRRRMSGYYARWAKDRGK